MVGEEPDRAQRARPARITRKRAGFTMVEVIIAIMVLGVGVLGLAGTTAYIIRQVTLADVMTERSTALQTTIEKLQSTSFTSISSGADSVGIFYVKWSSAVETSRSKIVTIITVGPGLTNSAGFPMLAANVPDTFEYRVIN